MAARGFQGSIPKDWLGCPQISSSLVADVFLVFKTPLKEALNQKVPRHDRFSLDDVFQSVGEYQRSKVLWIDLTNTSRYYDGATVAKREGFQYKKMALAGHGVPPSKEDQAVFSTCVADFLEVAGEDGMVTVHCTHGLNRTGFLICSYLIRQKGWTPEKAVREFMEKRAPGIYRENYVEQLFLLGGQMEGIGSFSLEGFVGSATWVTEKKHSTATAHLGEPRSNSRFKPWSERKSGRGEDETDSFASNYLPQNSYDRRSHSHQGYANGYFAEDDSAYWQNFPQNSASSNDYDYGQSYGPQWREEGWRANGCSNWLHPNNCQCLDGVQNNWRRYESGQSQAGSNWGADADYYNTKRDGGYGDYRGSKQNRYQDWRIRSGEVEPKSNQRGRIAGGREGRTEKPWEYYRDARRAQWKRKE